MFQVQTYYYISMKSILLIEDDLLQQQAVSETLGNSGYVVKQAFDIQSATALLGNEHFDMVILDWHLSDGIGEIVLDYVKNNRIDTRICVLSSDDRLDTINRAMMGGAIDFLSKADSNPQEILMHITDSIGR
jgi:DNA-binding NtrC family response regulator